MLSNARKACESFWDKFWDDLEDDVLEDLKVATDICKVAEPIAMGLELVSLGTASEVAGPVEGTCQVVDAISDVEGLLEEANDVISAI